MHNGRRSIRDEHIAEQSEAEAMALTRRAMALTRRDARNSFLTATLMIALPVVAATAIVWAYVHATNSYHRIRTAVFAEALCQVRSIMVTKSATPTRVTTDPIEIVNAAETGLIAYGSFAVDFDDSPSLVREVHWDGHAFVPNRGPAFSELSREHAFDSVSASAARDLDRLSELQILAQIETSWGH